MATGWPEAIQLKTVSTKAVIDVVIEIILRNGWPSMILSD